MHPLHPRRHASRQEVEAQHLPLVERRAVLEELDLGREATGGSPGGAGQHLLPARGLGDGEPGEAEGHALSCLRQLPGMAVDLHATTREARAGPAPGPRQVFGQASGPGRIGS